MWTIGEIQLLTCLRLLRHEHGQSTVPDTGVTDKHILTAGRIFEFVHGAEEGPPVITPANLSAIVNVLQESIGDEPHVAEKVSLDCFHVMHSTSLRDGTLF